MSGPLPHLLLAAGAEIGAGLAAGFLIGTAYFGLLWRGTRAVMEERTVIYVVGSQVLRLVLAGGALAPIAIYGGALALIGATGAIVAARELVLRRSGARS